VYADMKTWQEQDNSNHYTRERLCCDECGKYHKQVLEVIFFDGNKFFCWECFYINIKEHFSSPENDYVSVRMINDILFNTRKQTIKHKRSEMTLKKRFDIMTRDNFQCVLCGERAHSENKLEVDHIEPISKGGSNKEDNLRTLCFSCNRGKGGHYVK